MLRLWGMQARWADRNRLACGKNIVQHIIWPAQLPAKAWELAAAVCTATHRTLWVCHSHVAARQLQDSCWLICCVAPPVSTPGAKASRARRQQAVLDQYSALLSVFTSIIHEHSWNDGAYHGSLCAGSRHTLVRQQLAAAAGLLRGSLSPHQTSHHPSLSVPLSSRMVLSIMLDTEQYGTRPRARCP